MRAVIVEKSGGPPVIKSVAEPTVGANEVLVRVTAAGVNPIDWKSTERKDHAFPMVAGQDFSGVVVTSGKNVERFSPDDCVFGIAREHGSYCELTVLPENDHKQPVASMPQGLSYVDAAALPTAGLTALAALDCMRVGAGETLLILGVSGGVGSIAAQIAQQRGAHVLGTAHSRNREFVENLGTVDMIPYDKEDVVDGVRVRCPEGVDAVLDLVDDREHAIAVSDTIRPGGAIVSTIGALDEEWFTKHGMYGSNIVMNETVTSSPEGLLELAQLVESGMLRVPVTVEPTLTLGPQALEASKNNKTAGKTVLVVGKKPKS